MSAAKTAPDAPHIIGDPLQLELADVPATAGAKVTLTSPLGAKYEAHVRARDGATTRTLSFTPTEIGTWKYEWSLSKFAGASTLMGPPIGGAKGSFVVAPAPKAKTITPKPIAFASSVTKVQP